MGNSAGVDQKVVERMLRASERASSGVSSPQGTIEQPPSDLALSERMEEASLRGSTPEARGQAFAAQASSQPESVGAWARFLAQLTADPEARLRFLQERFGRENVGIDTASGQTFVRQDGAINVLDPSGFSLKDLPQDISDVAGEALEAAGSALGALGGGALGAAGGPPGIAAGGIAGSATGGAATRAGVEGLFGLLTGTGSDVVGEAAQAFVLGGLGEGFGRLVGAAGSKALTALGEGKEVLAGKFATQADSLKKSLAGLSRLPSGSESGAARAATIKAASAVQENIGALERERSRVAGGAIEAAIREGGDTPDIPLTKTLAALDELVSQYERTPIGDAPAAVVKSLTRQRDRLVGASTQVDGVPSVSLKQLQAALSETSAATGGRNPLVKALRRTSTDKRLAGTIQDALLSDLEEAVSLGGFSETAQRGLLEGRQLYAQMSQSIRDAQGGIFKKVLGATAGGGTETIPSLITSKGKATPSQVRTLSQFMSKFDGDGLSALQYSVVDDLLEGSIKAGELNPASFSAATQRAGRKLEALFEGTPTSGAQFLSLRFLGDRIAKNKKSLVDMQGFPRSLQALYDGLRSQRVFNAANAVSNAIATTTGRTAAIKFLQARGVGQKPARDFVSALQRQGIPFVFGAAAEEAPDE